MFWFINKLLIKQNQYYINLTLYLKEKAVPTLLYKMDDFFALPRQQMGYKNTAVWYGYPHIARKSKIYGSIIIWNEIKCVI